PPDDGEPDPLDPTGADASTAGTRFLLAYMENLNRQFNGPPTFEVWIESAVATQGEIRLPATGFTLPFDAPVGITHVQLPETAALEPQGSGVTVGLGIEVVVDDPAQVVGVHNRRFFSEATRLLPEDELGVNYRVLAVPSDNGLVPSEFVVVAGEDGTDVTITPSALTSDLRPADLPFTITLDAGQVFQLQSNEDLSGSLVEATQRVAVFGGGREPLLDCPASSHAWEQLPPTSRWATDWLVSPWRPDQPYGYALVIADADDTEVTLDCEPIEQLDAGQVARVRLDDLGRIRADKPVLVAQLSIGGDCGGGGGPFPTGRAFGDPNLLLATPAPLYRDAIVAKPLTDITFAEGVRRDRVVVFRESGALQVSPEPAERFERAIDGFDAELLGIDGPTTAENDALRGFAYGVSNYNAYSYSLGWDCEGCATELQTPATCD
ncbi:MAG: IgGFc-binding protein, partial [Myxococcota bacterium]